MKKRCFFGVIILLLVAGCVIKTTKLEVPEESPTLTQVTDNVEETPPTEEELPEEPEEKKCDNFGIPPQNIDGIELTIFTEGLNKNKEGFKFRLMPLDKEGNIIPLTGNLKVSFWTTKETNNKLTQNIEIYTKSFYLKKENVAADCSSQEMEINFEDMKSNSKYRFIPEDDPGIINFEFKRTGSEDLFEKVYNAADFDERVFP